MTTVLQALNASLHHVMETDERVYLIGEDLLDPYGGAFKVTRGLSTKYPQRVLSSPISEAGITGIAGGMALRGLRPVVEIMFGDFITLIADQVLNSLTKFHWMYNEQVDVPLVIRAPMGGRRGYGPTHSQTLEKHFLGIPGLRVLAPAALGDPGALLAQAITASRIPVLFVENKLLYLCKIITNENQNDFDITALHAPDSFAPTYRLHLRGAPPPALTITAYGYMAELARQAALRLAYEREIFTEIIVPTQLAPVEDPTPLLDSLRATRRLLTVEEGTYTLGWGAEVVASAVQALGPDLLAADRLAAKDLPIPASVPQEEQVLPQVEDIVQAALKLVE
jgi:pyruvate/2-oxoglutarate/acetoin dehydrogenase E1 component